MSITFKRAPAVAVGQVVTSTERNAIAQAFNDRLRSGVGDPSFRIFFYVQSLFRQIRNPDDPLFPPVEEFFEFYQNLLASEAEWPESGPGDPEGANIAAFINTFVFGSEGIDMDGEAGRISQLVPSTGGSAASVWTDGKGQRGAMDPDTNSVGSPAYSAAIEYLNIRSNLTSPHGNAYGGFLPSPPLTDLMDPFCGSPFEDVLRVTYLFTNLDDSSTLTYSSCDTNILYSPLAYYIYESGILTTTLLKEEWLEGPYTGGGSLVKTSADALQRVVNAWVKEFRGSTAQQQSRPEYHLDDAFDFEKFLTRQYGLAPNIGVESGPDINAVYPLFEWTEPAAAGIKATHVQSSSESHAYRAGFVLGSCHVSSSGLAGPVTITWKNGSESIKSMAFTPAGGVVDEIVLFNPAPTPSPLQIELDTAIVLGGGGYLRVECTEQIGYKPKHHDLYLFMRVATLDGSEGEGEGRTEDGAKTVGDPYFTTGVLHNIHDTTGPAPALNAVNTNAVFEAARRLSQWTRCIPRTAILDYAVEDGKSIVWFSRYRTAAGSTVDLFKGIAPGDEAVTRILPGYQYIADGAVTYDTISYGDGDTFTGVAGVETATGQVLEYEGIRAAAPASPDGRNPGETNEWIFRLETMAYNESSSSIHKPEVFGDYFALNNRCQWYSDEITGFLQPDMVDHFAYGQASPLLLVEAPSGYNYAKGTNNVQQAVFLADVRDNFYKSCRIYEPDDEIESITMDGENVKVVFKARFHHCESAPGSIAKGGATAGLGDWDLTALTNEEYRSRENAVRDYLARSAQECPKRLGDCAISSIRSSVTVDTGGVWDSDSGLHGSCFPHFFFTKLVPLVYADANNEQNVEDSRVTMDAYQQMELYLRAMCEGWMDKTSSESRGCTSEEGCLVDWSFENLCFAAFGGRTIGFLPSTKRPENPQGFGPIPNTEMEAEIHNRIASAVNLLVRARLEAPLQVESRQLTMEDFSFQTPDQDITGQGCTPSSGYAQGGVLISTPGLTAGTVISDTGWTTGGGNFEAGTGISWVDEAPLPGTSRFVYQCAGSTPQFKMRVTTSKGSLRVLSGDPAQEALPPDLRSHVVSAVGIFARVRLGRTWYTNDGGGEDACQDIDGPNAWCWNDHTTGDAQVSLTFHSEETIICIAVDGEAQLEPSGSPTGVTIGTAHLGGSSSRGYSSGSQLLGFGCHGGSYANFALTD